MKLINLTFVKATLEKVANTSNTLVKLYGVPQTELSKVEHFIEHALRQIDQIDRRIIKGEKIPHDEKVFSLFEEHTEWVSKGKAGVPVELGLKVCILSDQLGFILHHQVMQKQTDDKIAVNMIEEAQKRFPSLKVCSFDKGFHSPSNQETLANLLDLVCLPKKGKLSQKDRTVEDSDIFRKTKRQHAAVESAINALEVHGLDRCPDRGLDGFKRSVALAVLARNIQHLGASLQKQERQQQKRLEAQKRFQEATKFPKAA